MFGVDLDTPKLDTDFTNASPEVQQSVRAVKTAIRRGQLPIAVGELEQVTQLSDVIITVVTDDRAMKQIYRNIHN